MAETIEGARAEVHAPRPERALVYGNDHSPWVQAVLLGLLEQGIESRLVTAPPLPVFLESGVLMPVAQLGEGPWQRDSARILQAVGYSEVPADQRKALQQLFLGAAMYRVDPPWPFWHRFSFVRDDDPSPLRHAWNHLWRAFPIFYFFVLISLGRRRQRPRGAAGLVADFEAVQALLPTEATFLGGDAPDTADLQLFGLVQMCASIPGLPLQVLKESPELERLRGWIAVMHERFRGHPRLYSAEHFEPRLAAPRTASAPERGIFWLGAALCWLALPVTLPLALYYVSRVRRKALLRG